jgi:acyl carrier protein
MDRQAIWNTLAQLVEKEIDAPVPAIDKRARLCEGLGIDSVDLVRVAMRIEQHYRIRVSQRELTTARTVGDLLELVGRKVQARHAA